MSSYTEFSVFSLIGGLLTIASYTQCGSPSPNDSLFPPMPVAQAQMGFNPDLRGIFAPNLRDTNPQFVTGGTQGSCKSVRVS